MKKIIALALVVVMMMSLATAFAATGIGAVTTCTTTAATAEKAGSVAVNTTVCALTLDENGVIVGIRFDAIQPKSGFDTTGAATVDEKVTVPTKRERGDGYNMRPASPISKEWYEQANHFEAWCMGKTVADVIGMGVENGYPTDADVVSGCTIHITDFLAALANAYADIAAQ